MPNGWERVPLSNPLGFKHHPLEGAGIDMKLISPKKMRVNSLSTDMLAPCKLHGLVCFTLHGFFRRVNAHGPSCGPMKVDRSSTTRSLEEFGFHAENHKRKSTLYKVGQKGRSAF